MQITELLPELITKLAPTGPFPTDVSAQFAYWRQLVTKRQPGDLPKHYLQQEDQLLDLIWQKRGHVELSKLTEYRPGIYLAKGDLTRLKVDAIVNAANKAMLGCYRPNCNCLDNAIHTFAGVQLRNECYQVMQNVGRFVKVAQVLPTKAYNLPSKYVFHVAGPYVKNKILTPEYEKQLAQAYYNCLKLAHDNDLKSLAFCCISTGEFGFPNERAAQIASKTVKDFLCQTDSKLKVIFNVFKDRDLEIYQRIL